MIKHALLWIYLFLCACSHAQMRLPYGLNEKDVGYVPARIAVLPCRIWAPENRFKDLPLSNVTDVQMKAACADFENFVLSGFKDQAYMRGFSPAAVEKLLQAAATPDLLTEVDPILKTPKERCQDCQNEPAYYTNAIAPLEKWRDWIDRFSKSVRNADAVLLPFVMFAAETEGEDRGFKVQRRAVRVALFLVATGDARLIWSGQRQAEAVNQAPLTEARARNLKLPEWQQVYDRLFTEDIWYEFPGRQIY